MIGIPSRAPAGADGLQPHDWIDPLRQTANTGRWLRVGTCRGPGSSRRLPFRRQHRANAAQPLWPSSRSLAGSHFTPRGPHRVRTSHPQIASYRPRSVRARAETSLTAATPMLPRHRRMVGCFSYPPADRHGVLTRRCRRADEQAVRPVRAHRQASSIGAEI